MSRATGFLLVLAPCLGPGGLQPCFCPLHPQEAALEKGVLVALGSEAPASAPAQQGGGCRLVSSSLLGCCGPSFLPAASHQSPRGPGAQALLPWGRRRGGWSWRERAQRPVCIVLGQQLSFCRRSKPSTVWVPGPPCCRLCPRSVLCPLSPASSVNTCPCNKKGLSKCQRSYYLSVQLKLKAWPNKLKEQGVLDTDLRHSGRLTQPSGKPVQTGRMETQGD